MGTGRDPRMREALRLARVGDKEQARQLLIDILRQSRDDFDAWVVMAQVTGDHQEAVTCMKQALRLRPDDERAKRYLDYLLQGDQDSRKPAAVSPWLWGGLGAALIALMVVIVLLILPGLTAPEQTAAGQPTILPVNCAALINDALEISDQGCQQIGRNELCYGHNTVQAVLVPGSDASFDKPGSTIPLNILEEFIAAPLDTQKNEWGVGVFRLEANLPGTLPGQLVTMLAFGNTSVDNASGDMQAFYFMSGLGGLQCNAVDLDGLLVRMPDGAGFVFRANGTDITLQGSSILKAVADDKMSVTMLSGTGKVGAFDQEQLLGPGQRVTVPLGGSRGVDVDGPPSAPETTDDKTVIVGCMLTGQGCPSGSVAQVATNTPVPVDPNLPTNTPAPIDPGLPTYTPVPVLPGQPTNTSVPLPTNTPAPLPTNTSAPLPTKTSGPGASKTNTPGSSVATNTPKPGVTDTPLPTTTKTNTPYPTNTPTNTPEPSSTPTNTPTNTSTPTETPTLTNTPVTPTVDVCSTIGVNWGGINTTNNKVTINVSSGTPTTLETVQITDWPSGNGKLQNINDTYDVNAASPPSLVITLSMPINGSVALAFKFQKGVAETFYSFTLTFSGGCTKTFTH